PVDLIGASADLQGRAAAENVVLRHRSTPGSRSSPVVWHSLARPATAGRRGRRHGGGGGRWKRGGKSGQWWVGTVYWIQFQRSSFPPIHSSLRRRSSDTLRVLWTGAR